MKKKWIFICIWFLIIGFVSCSKDSPTSPEVKKTANLTISVMSTPILVNWNYLVQLWYMECLVQVSETMGVGVNVNNGKMAFIYNGQRYEEQTLDGLRVNANATQTYIVSHGTEYVYDAVEFSLSGKDDNGHSVSRTKQYDLKYVGL